MSCGLSFPQGRLESAPGHCNQTFLWNSLGLAWAARLRSGPRGRAKGPCLGPFLFLTAGHCQILPNHAGCSQPKGRAISQQ